MPLPIVPVITALAAGGSLVPHAAGGMMTSPRDLGRWLRLQLGGAAPAGFDVAAVEAAHAIGAQVQRTARNAYAYAAPSVGYAATLQVSRLGAVIDYPQLFEAIT